MREEMGPLMSQALRIGTPLTLRAAGHTRLSCGKISRCCAKTGLEGWGRWPWRGPRQGLAEMSVASPGAGWGGCFLWPAVGESGADYSQGAKALDI